MSVVVVCTGCRRRFTLGAGWEDAPCPFCGGTPRPEAASPDARTSATWERIPGGLTGTQIEMSERLLIKALGERSS